jgi:heme/copper-type cytochrome/quinol oxidase subunit 2
MGLLLFASANGPVAQNLSVFSPVSPPAELIRGLLLIVLAITGGIFLLAEGVLVDSLLRYRQRAPAGEAEPPRVDGRTPIEIAWTAAPLPAWVQLAPLDRLAVRRPGARRAPRWLGSRRQVSRDC